MEQIGVKSLMKLISNILVFIMVIGFSSFVTGTNVPATDKCVWKVNWIFTPLNLSMAIHAATEIVTGRVINISAGPSFSAPLRPEAAFQHMNHTQIITVKTLTRFKGDENNEIRIFKMGDDVCYPDDDPAYQVGESVVLFLTKKRDAPEYFLVIAPEGRFAVTKDDKLIPVATNRGFVEQWRNRPLKEFEQTLRKLLSEP